MSSDKQAVVYILAGMAVIGLIDNFMRFLTPEGSLWQFHLLRAVCSFGVLIALVTISKQSLRPIAPAKVALRSLLAGVSTLVYFASLGLLPITEVVAGLFTAPFFVVLYERLLFGVKMDGRRLAAVIIGFSGIVIGLGLYAGSVRPLMLLPILAGAVYGAANLYTSRVLKTERTLSMLAGYSLALGSFGLLGCLVFAFWTPEAVAGPEGFVWRGWQSVGGLLVMLVLFHAVGALIGMGLATKAYMLGDATTISVCENALLIFTALFALVLFGEVPSSQMLIGISMIFGAAALVATAPQDLAKA